MSLFSTGLERTDNGMKQTSWPEVQMINQKNYYTSVILRYAAILPLELVLSLFNFLFCFSPFQLLTLPIRIGSI